MATLYSGRQSCRVPYDVLRPSHFHSLLRLRLRNDEQVSSSAQLQRADRALAARSRRADGALVARSRRAYRALAARSRQTDLVAWHLPCQLPTCWYRKPASYKRADLQHEAACNMPAVSTSQLTGAFPRTPMHHTLFSKLQASCIYMQICFIQKIIQPFQKPGLFQFRASLCKLHAWCHSCAKMQVMSGPRWKTQHHYEEAPFSFSADLCRYILSCETACRKHTHKKTRTTHTHFRRV